MIDKQTYIPKFLNKLNENFIGRIYFVGLQGSYARNEATKKSDLDIVVIFDQL